VPPKLLYGVAAAGSLSYQLYVRLIADESGNPLVEQRMVINAEDSDLGLIVHEVPSLP
jgi:hypothetical protein